MWQFISCVHVRECDCVRLCWLLVWACRVLRGSAFFFWRSDFYFFFFLWHALNAHKTKGGACFESCRYFSASNGSRSRGGVQVHARWKESDCFERREISRIHWKWQADQLLGTCFQYATLCKRYVEEISCLQRHSIHPAEISLTFKTNWVCLLINCIYKYLPWFIYHSFVVVFF